MSTITVCAPSKLRRASRRRTWQCRIAFATEHRFRRAAEMQIAAQAVAAQELAIPVRLLAYDRRRCIATLDAAWLSLRYERNDRSEKAREALENDCLAIHAGIAARALSLGWEHTVYGWHDQELVCDLIDRIEYDECLGTSWHQYQRERARAFVAARDTWTRIELLAARFANEPMMDGDRVEAVLREPTTGHVVVPSQIPWRSAVPSGPSEVELVWEPPGLTSIVACALARQAADGDDQ
jgi:hypothetical protein